MASTIEDVSKKVLDSKSGRDIQDALNTGLKAVGRKLWLGTLSVMASGFGKGLLAAAAVVVVASIFLSGMGAVNAGMAFATGASAGITEGLAFLASGAGFGALAIGGTLGAVVETGKHQGRLRSEVAHLEKTAYEAIRLNNQTAAVESTKEPVAEEKNQPDVKHVMREIEKRQNAYRQATR